jgi:hypothetical protein
VIIDFRFLFVYRTAAYTCRSFKNSPREQAVNAGRDKEGSGEPGGTRKRGHTLLRGGDEDCHPQCDTREVTYLPPQRHCQLIRTESIVRSESERLASGFSQAARAGTVISRQVWNLLLALST